MWALWYWQKTFQVSKWAIIFTFNSWVAQLVWAKTSSTMGNRRFLWVPVFSLAQTGIVSVMSAALCCFRSEVFLLLMISCISLQAWTAETVLLFQQCGCLQFPSTDLWSVFLPCLGAAAGERPFEQGPFKHKGKMWVLLSYQPAPEAQPCSSILCRLQLQAGEMLADGLAGGPASSGFYLHSLLISQWVCLPAFLSSGAKNPTLPHLQPVMSPPEKRHLVGVVTQCCD